MKRFSLGGPQLNPLSIRIHAHNPMHKSPPQVRKTCLPKDTILLFYFFYLFCFILFFFFSMSLGLRCFNPNSSVLGLSCRSSLNLYLLLEKTVMNEIKWDFLQRPSWVYSCRIFSPMKGSLVWGQGTISTSSRVSSPSLSCSFSALHLRFPSSLDLDPSHRWNPRYIPKPKPKPESTLTIHPSQIP